MRQIHRLVALFDHGAGCAAKDRLAHSGMAVSAHDDQVCTDLFCAMQQAVGDILTAAWVLLNHHIAPVMGQPIGNIDAGVFTLAILRHLGIDRSNDWRAPTEWSSLNVSAWSASGLLA
jgi:hypothetical protein